MRISHSKVNQSRTVSKSRSILFVLISILRVISLRYKLSVANSQLLRSFFVVSSFFPPPFALFLLFRLVCPFSCKGKSRQPQDARDTLFLDCLQVSVRAHICVVVYVDLDVRAMMSHFDGRFE